MDAGERLNRFDEIQAALKTLWEEFLEKARTEAGVKGAESFYSQNIWPLLSELWGMAEFIGPHLEMADWSFDVTVHTLGTTPEPLVLAAIAADPKLVYILHSEDTAKYIGWINQQLGKQVIPWPVDKDDPTSIYRRVLEIVNTHKDARIGFDMTGGTKAMSAGLTAAAFFLQAQGRDTPAIYITNSDYNRSWGKPVPGTEYPMQLSNPYAVFGVLAEHMARKRYEAEDFRSAEQEFRELAKTTGDAARYEPFALLACGYAEWYSFNFRKAENNFQMLIERLQAPVSHRHPLLGHSLRAIKNQLQGLTHMQGLIEGCEKRSDRDVLCLKSLADREPAAWLVSTFQYLGREYYSDQPALAALAIYRGLELVMQHLLAQRGILAEQFSWDNLPPGTKQSVIDLGERVKNGPYTIPDAPWPITLTDGYLVLWALEDQVLQEAAVKFARENSKSDAESVLFTLRAASSARNESLLIHGFKALEASKDRNLMQTRSLLDALSEQLRGKGEFVVKPIKLPR